MFKAMLSNIVFPLPTYLLSFVYSALRRISMSLSISSSQPPLDLMFPNELISEEVSKLLPSELTVRAVHTSQCQLPS